MAKVTKILLDVTRIHLLEGWSYLGVPLYFFHTVRLCLSGTNLLSSASTIFYQGWVLLITPFILGVSGVLLLPPKKCFLWMRRKHKKCMLVYIQYRLSLLIPLSLPRFNTVFGDYILHTVARSIYQGAPGVWRKVCAPVYLGCSFLLIVNKTDFPERSLNVGHTLRFSIIFFKVI